MFSKEYFQSLESSWDRLKTCEKPIFIYGMGDGAEKLLDEFDRLGIKCTGVFAERTSSLFLYAKSSITALPIFSS